MSLKKRTICALMMCVLACGPVASAQSAGQNAGQDAAQNGGEADAWRALATRLEPGAEVRMRLHNGQRFRATIVGAEADAIVIQPKTRRLVPVQRVGYAAIASLERPGTGMGAGKAALIGVSTGAAAGFAVLMMLIAAYSD